ncbi:hypothetical protein SeMB42_g05992 [Synchytrium endobioticum]|uniref:Peroxidase n=1 Tax=Synchytrium endobioticum TaxID=286115 RepID=A0A507CL81_9FUNG|nr:hypothetical protein SeMB42_g05992 [Synchytrium endobioticum]
MAHGKYDEIRKDIAKVLKVFPEWDDGSLAPVLVRLAWHASGTYEKNTKSGGSNGATMRFAPESTDGANNGLQYARALLESVRLKYPWISQADLWTLAGCVAIEQMGGPHIEWLPGRSDRDAKNLTAKDVPPNGRLPDASKDAQHLRDVFYRMGFNDREIVALSGAHAVGRCHKDRSGYDGPWTRTPTRFSNGFYKHLLNETWKPRKWDGPLQYEDESGELMMLPTDMELIKDAKFKPIVEEYAKDKNVFFKDFACAFAKLIELGVHRVAADSAAKL